MEDQTCNILISQLREPKTVLRAVNHEAVEYLELRDSIRDRGIINSICVRPASEPGLYEIVDGLYRFNCCCDLGIESIPCIIKHHVTDYDVLAIQVAANALRPETKPVEFARQMKKMMRERPEMTFAEMACLIRKSPEWVSSRLGLLALKKDIARMVDRGEIPLGSAYMLAKIPQCFQEQHVDQALTLTTPQFRAIAASVIKAYTEAVKQGKMDAFYAAKEPHPYLRPLKEVEAELSHEHVGALVVVTENCKTPLDGFYAALRWAARMDRQSLIEREAAERRKRKESA